MSTHLSAAFLRPFGQYIRGAEGFPKLLEFCTYVSTRLQLLIEVRWRSSQRLGSAAANRIAQRMQRLDRVFPVEAGVGDAHAVRKLAGSSRPGVNFCAPGWM
jgi:hypothetical protein